MAKAPQAASDRFTEEYDLLREEAAIVAQPPLAIIELTGEDRKGWLQGQATNDVKQLDVGASSHFCLCEPTGQILAVCDVWGLAGRFILTCELPAREATLDRIESMVVMEDVVARDLTDQMRLISIQGPQATRGLGELVPLPTLDAAEASLNRADIVVLRSNRTGLGGWDVLVPTSDAKAIKTLEGAFPSVGEDAFLAARLEAGRPLYGLDYNGKTLPPEMGKAFEVGHVSYDKGCYTGQEVLMRLHSRGHTNYTWMALLAEGPIAAGDIVKHRSRPDAGVVTSVANSPDFGFIGAARLRNEIVSERETVEVITASGSVEAQMKSMPLLRFE
jgi:folate-binding protein YgfZ